ncbi:MAG: EF-P beta-lysylation protein EpmB [Gammaproteobacteria bacterium]|jgi:EF-P beta-lysylation protein EpmB
MIQLSAPILQGRHWKNSLAQAIRDPRELLELLDLPIDLLPAATSAAASFPLRVPRSYLRRIVKGDIHDPLLRQVLPLGDENISVAGYNDDPVGDLAAQRGSGLLHKYAGRALLVATGACAVHCRYCFRRNFPYSDCNPLPDQWQQAVQYLASRRDIHEVILSGGDPLSLSDERLSALVSRLQRINHLKTLRIHTRLPVVIPERVCDELLQWLQDCTMKVVMVLHINHANEIDSQIIESAQRLKQQGIILLNQSVLLKDVNDTAQALSALSHALLDAGILPYYLHQLDKVSGAAHFAVDDECALQLLDMLRIQLPGYLVPKLVREIAGEPGKQPVGVSD